VLLEDFSRSLIGLVFAFLGIFLGSIFGLPYLDGVGIVVIGLLFLCSVSVLMSTRASILIGREKHSSVSVFEDYKLIEDGCGRRAS
jgi:divalent metal cation (Fe/Co/Zn/Cd) transporter